MDLVLLLAGFLTAALQCLPPRDPALLVCSGYFGMGALFLSTLFNYVSCPIWIGSTFLFGLLLELAVITLCVAPVITSLVIILVPCEAEPEQSSSRVIGMAVFAAWILAAWLYMQWLTARPAGQVESAFLATLVPLTWVVDFQKNPKQQYCPWCLPHAARWSALACLVIAAWVRIKAFQRCSCDKSLVVPV